MAMRALREEQVEAERILLATQSALDRCRPAGAAERAALAVLEQGVRDALRALERRGRSAPTSARTALHDAVQALAHGTEEFAARRMDKSVRKALAGKSLDQV
jgi:molecular chaperone HscA